MGTGAKAGWERRKQAKDGENWDVKSDGTEARSAIAKVNPLDWSFTPTGLASKHTKQQPALGKTFSREAGFPVAIILDNDLRS